MADRPLEGKVALVTGAGSPIGFGRRMTFALTAAGARVAMVDIKEEWLNQTADEVRAANGKDSVLPVVASVADPDDAARAVESAISSLGGLDILVNNAGTNPRNVGLTTEFREKCWEVSPEAWVRVYAVNCSGPFFTVRAAVGHMIEKGWGRIIGVTTSLDTMYRAYGSPYGPSKAGHEAFMATLCQELDGTGVTANVLVPGAAGQHQPDTAGRSLRPGSAHSASGHGKAGGLACFGGVQRHQRPALHRLPLGRDGAAGRAVVQGERARRVAPGGAGRHRAGPVGPVLPVAAGRREPEPRGE